MNYELIGNIIGAEFKEGKLIINIPGSGDEFTKHDVVIEKNNTGKNI